MSANPPKPGIPESFLEHRIVFSVNWVNRWTIPNPFIETLFPLLKPWGVELTDVSFNKDAANVGDTYLNFAVRKVSAAIRVGLDYVAFIIANPDWSMAPQLVELFDGVSVQVQEFIKAVPHSQHLTLAFHVTPGDVSFKERTGLLVNQGVLGEALFYGISLHQRDGSLVIDKSLKYEGAAFVRLQRIFEGTLTFAQIAPELYKDETNALNLIGITGID